MKQNKQGFSIIIAAGIVLLVSILAMSILSYIIPFARDVKGIENSVGAYYEANSGVENAMYFLKSAIIGQESENKLSSGAVSNGFFITASGTLLPSIWKGNSEFDNNFNIIRTGQPIQLEVGKGFLNTLNWSNVKIYFKVPNMDQNTTTSEVLNGGNLPIVNWSLVTQNNSLSAFSSYVKASDVCNSKDVCQAIDFFFKQWIDLNGNKTNQERFATFYGNNCLLSTQSCILKLSIVNPLQTINFTKIPYLEWRMDFGNKTIPLSYGVIQASGKSYGFKRDIELRVPQQTVSEVFDFTVFQ